MAKFLPEIKNTQIDIVCPIGTACEDPLKGVSDELISNNKVEIKRLVPGTPDLVSLGLEWTPKDAEFRARIGKRGGVNVDTAEDLFRDIFNMDIRSWNKYEYGGFIAEQLDQNEAGSELLDRLFRAKQTDDFSRFLALSIHLARSKSGWSRR